MWKLDFIFSFWIQLSHNFWIFRIDSFLLYFFNQLARHCSYYSMFKHQSKPFAITIPLSSLRTDFTPPQSLLAVDDNRLCAVNKEPGYRWYHPYHSLRFHVLYRTLWSAKEPGKTETGHSLSVLSLGGVAWRHVCDDDDAKKQKSSK